MSATEPPREQDAALAVQLRQLHLKLGWVGLLAFLALGLVLETFHGLKLGYYLDDRNTTRRLMWTLAHTHGTLFSMVHVGFALSVGYLASAGRRGLLLASRCLIGGLILMPLGFFLGGLWLYGGDPGPGVFLVPAGGLFMLVAVTAIVIMARGKRLVTETPGAERTRRHRPRRG